MFVFLLISPTFTKGGATMNSSYYGQDILAAALALTTAIANSSNDLDYINFVGNLLMLSGQQIVTIASGMQLYCPENPEDEKLVN